jgi:hypothetical protein
VRDFEDLLGALPELVYLGLEGQLLHPVVDVVQADHPLVAHVVENVVRLDRLLASLLVPEDQVDPVVQVVGNVVAFKRVPVYLQELGG